MQQQSVITYFAREGRENLLDCTRLSFGAAKEFGLQTIVIFTAQGEGLQLAASEYLSNMEFTGIRVIGVTFPHGTSVGTDEGRQLHSFPADQKKVLHGLGIPVISANLPFSPIAALHQTHGMLAQDLSIVGNALNVFGGGMSLCIQAALLACDAGEISLGEHVITMTADTALLVRAAPTRGFLTDFVVRQIICKPAFFTISKQEQPVFEGQSEEEIDVPQPSLTDGSSATEL